MQYVSDWWYEFSRGVNQFVFEGGPGEIAVITGVVLAFGLLCMKGFQIR